ncbi:hypothetical protein L3Y34_019902 [Caenorhabditis briggsae]|uniref:Uncharacterized protein n=1 Tax=Caenorhabditis briggsae TaxID=6238 RepID=A0AAE9DQI2_CAEBR|nr:hypothetical protein L3Y34_019902 [Caenorhabditis briggsae]
MVEPTGPEVVVDERTKALNNYRRKLAECRDIEQKLKDLRKKESEMTKQFDKSENDIKSLQSVGQIVGEVLKQLSEEKFIVKATNGPRYVVGCRRSINKEELKQGTRVSLDMTTLTIMRQLPREVDPLVYKMSHEDPGNISYSDVGGLAEQIHGFSAADLRNVCTEAGMFAIRAEREFVIDEDFMKAVRKVGDAKRLETKLDYKPV